MKAILRTIAAGAAFFAASALAGQGSLTVTDLDYSLQALDGGAAPSIGFADSWVFGFAGAGRTTTSPGDSFSVRDEGPPVHGSVSYTAALPGASGSVAVDWSPSQPLPTSIALAVNYAPLSGSTIGSSAIAATDLNTLNTFREREAIPTVVFTLAPHSAATFEATVAWSFDPGAEQAGVVSSVDAFYSLGVVGFDRFGAVVSNEGHGDTPFAFGGAGVVAGSEVLSASVFNTTDTPMYGGLDLSLRLYGSISGPSPVPEPSSMLALAAGLGLMVTVRRLRGKVPA